MAKTSNSSRAGCRFLSACLATAQARDVLTGAGLLLSGFQFGNRAAWLLLSSKRNSVVSPQRKVMRRILLSSSAERLGAKRYQQQQRTGDVFMACVAA